MSVGVSVDIIVLEGAQFFTIAPNKFERFEL